MIIQEINELINHIETINEGKWFAKRPIAKNKIFSTGNSTFQGLKDIGSGVASVGTGAIKAWKPLVLAAGGAKLYDMGREDQKFVTNPTVAGLSALGGAAAMYHLNKKNRENSQFSN